MNKNLLAVVAILIVLGGGYAVYSFYSGPSSGGMPSCTQEAKLCPDGSAVSRTGPNCSFAPCPNEQSPATPPGGVTTVPPTTIPPATASLSVYLPSSSATTTVNKTITAIAIIGSADGASWNPYTLDWGDGSVVSVPKESNCNSEICPSVGLFSTTNEHTHAYTSAGTYLVQLTTAGATVTQTVIIK